MMQSDDICDYCVEFSKCVRTARHNSVWFCFDGKEVEPVRHAEWKRRKFSWDFDILQCTNCRYEYTEKDILENKVVYRYCPNCGARMDGDE